MSSNYITTNRLRLRPVGFQDVSDICAGVGPFEVARWLTHVPHPYTKQDAEDFIARNASGFPRVAGIERDGDFIGVVGVQKELGYWLAQKAWGLGYAREAARALVDVFFDVDDADILRSGYFLDNSRSRNVLIKLGFQPCEVAQQTSRATGLLTSVQKMQLTRAAWKAAS